MGEDKKKEKKSKKKEKKEEEPKAEESGGGEEAEEKSEAKRAHRGTSNVFALFNKAQIQEFKEAFTMMDQDRDGVISLDDLKGIYEQTGKEAKDAEVKKMLDECGEKLNFTHFLNLFGEKMHGTDPESTLLDAFLMFDEEKKGTLPEEYVKDLLTNVGDIFNKEEMKLTWKEIPLEGGQVKYEEFVRLIKRGKEDMA